MEKTKDSKGVVRESTTSVTTNQTTSKLHDFVTTKNKITEKTITNNTSILKEISRQQKIAGWFMFTTTAGGIGIGASAAALISNISGSATIGGPGLAAGIGILGVAAFIIGSSGGGATFDKLKELFKQNEKS
jgi:hypothetical protein